MSSSQTDTAAEVKGARTLWTCLEDREFSLSALSPLFPPHVFVSQSGNVSFSSQIFPASCVHEEEEVAETEEEGEEDEGAREEDDDSTSSSTSSSPRISALEGSIRGPSSSSPHGKDKREKLEKNQTSPDTSPSANGDSEGVLGALPASSSDRALRPLELTCATSPPIISRSAGGGGKGGREDEREREAKSEGEREDTGEKAKKKKSR